VATWHYQWYTLKIGAMLSATLVSLAFLMHACTFLALIRLIMFHFYLISYRGGTMIISPRHHPPLSNLGS